MKRPRIAALAALVVCALLAGLVLRPGLVGTATPRDRVIALPLPPDRPLRLTVLGTSLSHGEVWPEALARRLAACLAHPTEIAVIARPGAAVDWGLGQVAAVAATAPDVVLVEFAINDADLRDGSGLSAARRGHEALVAALRAAAPGARIVLMTMSPAQGLRGLLRPRLGAHYRQYRALAAEEDLGLVDLYPRWRALPRPARGLGRDGLHPEPEVAAGVIVPAVAGVLASGVPGGRLDGQPDARPCD